MDINLSKEQNRRLELLIKKCEKSHNENLDIYEVMDSYKCYVNASDEVRNYIYDLVKDKLGYNDRKPKKYGYIRVSTRGQAKDGNSLESQESALNLHNVDMVYTDVFTGSKTQRPEFQKLLRELKSGDTLVVTKLDRFARSLMEGSKIVNELIERGVIIHILNIGIMDNTPSSKLIRNIFFSFAEFERDMIMERTREGKEIARKRPDFKEGRPKKYTNKQIKLALSLLENNSYKEVELMTGISKSTLIRAKRKDDLL